MAKQRFDLFLELFNLYEADGNFDRCLAALSDAINGDEYVRKPAVWLAFYQFKESRSIPDCLALLKALDELFFDAAHGYEDAVKFLLAVQGHEACQWHVGETLLNLAFFSDVHTKQERDAYLTKALGWISMPTGLPMFVANDLSSSPNLAKLATLRGFEMVTRIREMSDLSPLLNHAVQDSDQPVPRDRYAQGGLDQVKMPFRILGTAPRDLYSDGFNHTPTAFAAIARRLAERFPGCEQTCFAIVDNPTDRDLGWKLLDEIKSLGQYGFDAREEIEGLLFCLGQLGDRKALLESALCAFRRGYHDESDMLLRYALGVLAMASGAVQAEALQPMQDGFGVRLKAAGRHAALMLVKGIKREIKSENETRTALPTEEEKAALTAPTTDEECDTIVDILEDAGHERPGRAEISESLKPDANPGVLRRLEAERKEQQRQEAAAIAARKAALESHPDYARVVVSIGNKDSARECKIALDGLEKLKTLKRYVSMPTDLQAWRQELVDEFPHCTDAIDAFHGDLLQRQAAGLRGFLIRPTVLVGPPGTGKSRLARRLAQSAELHFRSFNAGGNSDGHFGGVSRGWSSGHPSLPLDAVRACNAPNPVILIDEIDKSGTSRHNGNLHDVLIGMLEVETAKSWHDPFTQGGVNLSGINWIFTANEVEDLPGPFRDRVRIVRIDHPRLDHLPQLARLVLHELAPVRGQADWVPPLSPEELDAIAEVWVGNRSLRSLKRLVEAVLKSRDMAAPRH